MSDAVTRYLLALKDPTQLIDQGEIDQAQKTLDDETDPVKRVMLQADLRKAKRIPMSEIEEAFVQEAKAWADEQGVIADDFVAEGVDEAVLQRAGFPASERPKGTRRTRRRNSDEVRRQILQVFTSSRKPLAVRDLNARLDLGTGTARRIVTELVEAGQIEEAGHQAPGEGPGRAPTLYQRAKKRKE